MDERLQALGIPTSAPWKKWAFRIGVLVVLLAVIGGTVLLWRSRQSTAPRFEQAFISSGELVATVTATGTLVPRNTVDVGPEISGRVRVVNVDANDHVSAQQVLAEIDTVQIQAQVRTARANVASSTAQVALARAALADVQNTLRRTTQLHERQLASDQEFDVATGAVARAQAEVSAALARTSVSRAELDRIASDLDRAQVLSPIDGIILSRNVEPGQSVAATLSSPVFFRIAEGLSELELHVNVDEADVGSVREGLESTFTVDAHADRTFRATIARLHYASVTVANVVTYEAELAVDNADGALRPGMTATATIVTERRVDQLLVPNAALRFVPPVESRFGGPRAQATTGTNVWVMRNGVPTPIPVEAHGTDGRSTAITGEGIAVGVQVLTGLARDDEAPAAPETPEAQ